jgi:hypothetical protein
VIKVVVFKISIFDDGNRSVGPVTAAPHEQVAIPTSNLPEKKHN